MILATWAELSTEGRGKVQVRVLTAAKSSRDRKFAIFRWRRKFAVLWWLSPVHLWKDFRVTSQQGAFFGDSFRKTAGQNFYSKSAIIKVVWIFRRQFFHQQLLDRSGSGGIRCHCPVRPSARQIQHRKWNYQPHFESQGRWPLKQMCLLVVSLKKLTSVMMSVLFSKMTKIWACPVAMGPAWKNSTTASSV